MSWRYGDSVTFERSTTTHRAGFICVRSISLRSTRGDGSVQERELVLGAEPSGPASTVHKSVPFTDSEFDAEVVLIPRSPWPRPACATGGMTLRRRARSSFHPERPFVT